MRRQALVIGGGAAGIFAAIRAAEDNPEIKVSIWEAQSRPLGKVRISGGGRCNVTHFCLDPLRLASFYPRGSKELRTAFSRFSVEDSIQWFEDRGLKLKTESDGRMFPVSDRSESVISCLTDELRRLNVSLLQSNPVKSVSVMDDRRYLVKSAVSEEIFDSLILATGSNRHSYDLARSLGHNIVPPVPSLFSFQVNDVELRQLSGLSFKKVKAWLDVGSKSFVQEDPMLITHWGLSGPLIIRLSAWAARELFDSDYRALLKIDYLPEQSRDELLHLFRRIRSDSPSRLLKNENSLHLPQRFWSYLIQRLGILEKQAGQLSNAQIEALISALKSHSLEICGKGVFKEEFVTCGGVSRDEIDFRTMGSKIRSGLYIVGELADVDGITGGFNFQFAWTSGYLAGKAAAHYLREA